jgi:hypothetical protein
MNSGGGILDSMTFGPSNGDWDAAADGSVSVEWNGGIVLDIQQALVDNGIAFANGATKVSLEVVNRLTSGSEPGTSSFISKKDFHSFSITAMGRPVPDSASTGILLLLACGSLLGARRKLSGKEELGIRTHRIRNRRDGSSFAAVFFIGLLSGRRRRKNTNEGAVGSVERMTGI